MKNLDHYEIKTYRAADGTFASPMVDMYYYQAAQCKTEDGILYCRLTDGDEWHPFPDNFCPKFLGQYPAIIRRKLNDDEDPQSIYRQERV